MRGGGSIGCVSGNISWQCNGRLGGREEVDREGCVMRGSRRGCVRGKSRGITVADQDNVCVNEYLSSHQYNCARRGRWAAIRRPAPSRAATSPYLGHHPGGVMEGMGGLEGWGDGFNGGVRGDGDDGGDEKTR